MRESTPLLGARRQRANPNPNPNPNPYQVLEGSAQAARQQISHSVDVDTADDEGTPLAVEP